MDKKTNDDTVSGKPIGGKVIAKMQRCWQGKNLAKIINGLAAAEDLQRAMVGDLSGFRPARAHYIYTQNQMSVISEQLTALKDVAPFAEVISRAEDLYMPSTPPMSPLKTSFFTFWAFFDAYVGAANETIGTTILAHGAAFGIHSELFAPHPANAGLADGHLHSQGQKPRKNRRSGCNFRTACYR